MNYYSKLSAGEFCRTWSLKRADLVTKSSFPCTIALNFPLSYYLLQSELITLRSKREPAGLRAGQVTRLQNAIYKDLKQQQSLHTGARSSLCSSYLGAVRTFSQTVVIKVNWRFCKKAAFCFSLVSFMRNCTYCL